LLQNDNNNNNNVVSLDTLTIARRAMALRVALPQADSNAQTNYLKAIDTITGVAGDKFGDGFIVRLLDACGGNIEEAVESILSDKLPSAVNGLARLTSLAQLANLVVARRDFTVGADRMRERMSVYKDVSCVGVVLIWEYHN